MVVEFMTSIVGISFGNIKEEGRKGSTLKDVFVGD